MLPRRFHFMPQTGFTLVELVIVIVVLGIISVYAVMKSVSQAEVTLFSQAQKLAGDIRHAQTLAYTSGNRMRLTIDSGTYSVCVAGAPAAPCNTTSNDSTSNDFRVTLQKGVTLSGSTALPAMLDFNSLGRPIDSSNGTPVPGATSYCLNIGSSCGETVSVAALTGVVKVCPPATCP